MKCSVIIPTCHRNDALSLCLDRLAPGRQTLDPSEYEVIVTDDGTRSTAEALVRQKYPWARWVAGPRKGPAANRNNGARLAAGDWLAFTDDDCLPSPGWLAAFFAAGGPGIDVLEGKTTCEEGLRSDLEEAPVNLTGGAFPSCNLIVRRAIFDRLGRFDEDFPFWCEDQYFHALVRRAGVGTRFVSDAVIDHPKRRRPSGWQMGLRWEARILLWHKEGNVSSVWTFFPIHCLKVRVSQNLAHRLQWDTIRAAFSIAAELICLVMHLNEWDRKYRAFGPARDIAGSRRLNAGAQ